jgi:hypothetical protein
MSDNNIFDVISELTEFNDISAYMNDKDLDEALALVIKLIVRSDVPAAKAPELIVKLQAMSAKFQMLARYYTSFEKGVEAGRKKNVYYTASDAIDKLTSAMKYTMRGNY